MPVCNRCAVLGTESSVRGWTLLAAIAAAALVFSGCGESRTASTAISTGKMPVPPRQVQLVRADGKALEELIAKHQGQVVVVDYWATWCLPCVENFPHTVALAKKYREQGLAAISVSFDRFDDEPQVREFLAKKGADFDNIISQHDSVGQKAFADFDSGRLPEYRLYDRQGKLRKKWEGGVDQAELEKTIVELLAESKA